MYLNLAKDRETLMMFIEKLKLSQESLKRRMDLLHQRECAQISTKELKTLMWLNPLLPWY
jgi:hypothetical protein